MRADLCPQPVRPQPRLVEIATELRGLVDRRVAVGDENPDLRVHPTQVRVDLVRVVSPTPHREHAVGRGCDGFGHAHHRTGRTRSAAGAILSAIGSLSPGRGASAFPARGRSIF